MKRNAIACVVGVLSLCAMASTAFAEQTIQFAPARNESPAQQPTTATFSDEFEILSKWETKIVAAIPQSIKDSVNNFDAKRAELAGKYSELRDTSEKASAVSVEVKGSKVQASVDAAPKAWYYLYAALAFFFGYRFIFYGAILAAIFFGLRIIFRYFNIIV